MQVRSMDLDHLVEFQLATIDAVEQLDRDGNLERAGHGEPLVPVERDLSAGFEMNDAGSHGSASHTRNSLYFALQSTELRIGSGERVNKKEESRERGDK